MNDILNDIEKLENLKKLLWEKDLKDFSRNKISDYIQEMIKEKLEIVSEFEKQAPDHIQELNNIIKGVA